MNVWGDGGIITTNSDELANKLRLLRNHGLSGRDECLVFSYNSRLDTIQAIVALHLLKKLDYITDSRIQNARYLDQQLQSLEFLTIPIREDSTKQVYHLYSICVPERDDLQRYLVKKGIDAKIHYPVPMHLQPAAQYLGYKRGDFPISEHIASHTLSLPVHEFLSKKDMDYMIQTIKDYYV